MKKLNVIIILFIFCLIGFSCTKDTSADVLVEQSGRITASYKMEAVNTLANQSAETLRLISVCSENVNIDGTSSTWTYKYMPSTSASPQKVYQFFTSYNGIESSENELSGMWVGASTIQHSWSNSNVALDIAEKNGGSQFRTKNPSYTIEASVGEPLVPNSTTYWYITYRSSENSSTNLMLIIDANTGEISSKYE
jgi:hypothetical protein